MTTFEWCTFVCPEAVPLRAVGEVCGRCFMERSAAGTCGWEGDE
jgi:hypothetical protein